MKEWVREKPWIGEAKQGDEMEEKVGYGK